MRQSILTAAMLALVVACFIGTGHAQLAVSAATPSGQLADLSEAREIIVTFSEPVRALSAIATGETAPFEIQPRVRGKIRWLGTTSFAFRPASPLPSATQFRCRIPADTRALSGARLPKDYIWTFSTPRPRVLRHSPFRRQRDVSEGEKIWLFFDQRISLASAQGHVQASSAGGTQLAIRARYPTDDELQQSHTPIRRAPNTPEPHPHRTIIFEPVMPWPLGETITLRLEAGLLGEEGPLPMERPFEIQFTIREPFRFLSLENAENLRPDQSLTFNFSNPVKISEFMQHFKLMPEVPIPAAYANWNWATKRVILSLPLQPRTEYTFTISRELKNQHGNTLPDEVQDTFATGDYAPDMNMPVGYGILEADFPAKYPLEILNVDSFAYNMVALSARDIVTQMAGDNANRLFWSQQAWPIFKTPAQILRPQLPLNERHRLPLDLAPALDGARSGFVGVQVSFRKPGEDDARYYKALVQVTSLGLTGKFSPARNLIFVTRLQDAAPVAGAKVELRSEDNRILWQGITGEDGTVETPGWARLGLQPKSRWQAPLVWVFVRAGAAQAFCRSDWGTGISPWRFNIAYDWNPQPISMSANLQTDRGIYRAGETVYFKGIVRQKDAEGAWHIPFAPQLQLLIQDARGEELVKKSISLNNFGAFDDSLHIARSASLGRYWMHLSWKKSAAAAERAETIVSQSFRVEAFRPAEFEVTILPIQPPIGEDEYVFGDSLHARVQGRYLFGAAMAGARCEWRLQLHPFDFQYHQWKGYVFGPRVRQDQAAVHGRTLLSGSDSLNAQGEMDVRALLTAPAYRGGASLLIEATATSPSRQQISGRKTVKVHRGEFEIGAKLPGYLFPAARAIACSVVVVRASGEAMPRQPIAARLKHVQWHSVRKAGVGGRFHWLTERRETVVDSTHIVSATRPVAWRMLPAKAGYYIIELQSQDRRGNVVLTSTSFYASGAGYVAWARSDDDFINIIADAEDYAPGDTATLLIQSPYELVQALVTVERETIIERHVQQLSGSSPTLRIPIRETFLPNVFVSVVLLQGRTSRYVFSEAGQDVGKPQFKLGYAMLRVSPDSRRLTVDVSTDKAQYRPGQSVRLLLEARDARGTPAFAELTVAVVDAGVLNLIGHRLQDPFDSFYGPRSLGVSTVETLLHLIEQRNYGEKAEKPGGSGALAKMAGIDLRSRFHPLAYWNSALRTEANGKTTAHFTLPENLTTFRVMVIAHTRDSKFGEAQTDFVVNKPLLLQKSSPRFVRTGDRFFAGVVATNNTPHAGELTLAGSAEGLTLSGEWQQNATLQPGESREILFQATATTAGEAKFAFRARLRTDQREETDGLAWSIPVQVPFAPETVALSGQTTDTATETLQPPQNIFRERSYLDVTAASTAMVNLRGSLDYLITYPYGCLEQRVSKILSIVLGEKLMDAFELTNLSSAERRKLVQATLREVANFQHPSGGFAFWEGGSIANPYASMYCLWALVEARQRGYSVPERTLQRALKYAQQLLRQKFRPHTWPWGGKSVYLATRALAYFALGRGGRQDPNYGEALFAERENMPLFAKAFLLRGLLQHQAAVSMRETLARELMNKIKVEAATAHFEEAGENDLWWCWSSTARTTAILLQALLETDSPFPHADRVARWLLQERRLGRWRSTQENMYAFHALATYLERFEPESPEFTVRVRLAGKSLLQEIFSGRSDRIGAASIPLSALPAGRQLALEFAKQGQGRLYYGARMRYYPREAPLMQEQGMSLYKKIVVYKGQQRGEHSYAAGSMLQITLQLTVPQERHFVVLEDPLPAGFEAVNVYLNTESQAVRENQLRQQAGGGAFVHTEMHDDRVLAFADWLPAGTHTFSYLVRASGLGSFVAPPAYAEEMYAPEIFARELARRIEIEQ